MQTHVRGIGSKGDTLRRTQGAGPFSRIWLQGDVGRDGVKGAEEHLVFVKKCDEFLPTVEVCEGMCEEVVKQADTFDDVAARSRV
jgi:hypothetical protein